VLQVDASVWVDFVSVQVAPDPSMGTSGTPAAVAASTADGSGDQESALGRRARATVAISLHEREGGEVEVKAWELRHVVARGDQARKQPGQRSAREWKAIEVEVEIPLRLEKTLDHWRQAAASVAASSTPATASAVASVASPGGAAAAVGEQGGASGSFSYLSAAKGMREGEEEEDEDYRTPTYVHRRSSQHVATQNGSTMHGGHVVE
jgi:hypothetical protein